MMSKKEPVRTPAASRRWSPVRFAYYQSAANAERGDAWLSTRETFMTMTISPNGWGTDLDGRQE